MAETARVTGEEGENSVFRSDACIPIIMDSTRKTESKFAKVRSKLFGRSPSNEARKKNSSNKSSSKKRHTCTLTREELMAAAYAVSVQNPLFPRENSVKDDMATLDRYRYSNCCDWWRESGSGTVDKSTSIDNEDICEKIMEIEIIKVPEVKLGLGVAIETEKENSSVLSVTVKAITVGSPASLAGLRLEDRVLAVNDQLVTSQLRNDCLNLFRQAGFRTKFSIARPFFLLSTDALSRPHNCSDENYCTGNGENSLEEFDISRFSPTENNYCRNVLEQSPTVISGRREDHFCEEESVFQILENNGGGEPDLESSGCSLEVEEMLCSNGRKSKNSTASSSINMASDSDLTSSQLSVDPTVANGQQDKQFSSNYHSPTSSEDSGFPHEHDSIARVHSSDAELSLNPTPPMPGSEAPAVPATSPPTTPDPLPPPSRENDDVSMDHGACRESRDAVADLSSNSLVFPPKTADDTPSECKRRSICSVFDQYDAKLKEKSHTPKLTRLKLPDTFLPKNDETTKGERPRSLPIIRPKIDFSTKSTSAEEKVTISKEIFDQNVVREPMVEEIEEEEAIPVPFPRTKKNGSKEKESSGLSKLSQRYEDIDRFSESEPLRPKSFLPPQKPEMVHGFSKSKKVGVKSFGVAAIPAESANFDDRLQNFESGKEFSEQEVSEPKSTTGFSRTMFIAPKNLEKPEKTAPEDRQTKVSDENSEERENIVAESGGKTAVVNSKEIFESKKENFESRKVWNVEKKPATAANTVLRASQEAKTVSNKRQIFEKKAAEKSKNADTTCKQKKVQPPTKNISLEKYQAALKSNTDTEQKPPSAQKSVGNFTFTSSVKDRVSQYAEKSAVESKTNDPTPHAGVRDRKSVEFSSKFRLFEETRAAETVPLTKIQETKVEKLDSGALKQFQAAREPAEDKKETRIYDIKCLEVREVTVESGANLNPEEDTKMEFSYQEIKLESREVKEYGSRQPVMEQEVEKAQETDGHVTVVSVNLSTPTSSKETGLIGAEQSTIHADTERHLPEKEESKNAKFTLEKQTDLISQCKEMLGADGENYEVFEITLQRDKDYMEGSVGLILTGSADSGSGKIDIVIHRVTTGSLADEDGRVRKGDRLLAVQGSLTNEMTTAESRAILKAHAAEVCLVLGRKVGSCLKNGKTERNLGNSASQKLDSNGADSSTASSSVASTPAQNGSLTYSYSSTPYDVQLNKNSLTGLGLSLEGGKGSSHGDLPLTIKRIFAGGAADKGGQLKVGDQILAINGDSLVEMTNTEAWKLLKQIPDGAVTLTVLPRT